jgi:hypothetical protein
MRERDEENREEISSADRSAMIDARHEATPAPVATHEPEQPQERESWQDLGEDDGESPLSTREAARRVGAERYSEWQKRNEEARATIDAALGDTPEAPAAPVDTDAAALRAAEEQARSAILEERQRITEIREHQEQVRGQWMQALQSQLAVAVQQAQADFPEVKTEADLANLAANNPARYAQIRSRMDALSRITGQLQAADQQARSESRQQAETWAESEDAKFQQQNPEFRDPANAPKVRQMVIENLRTRGVTDQELTALWNMQSGINIRDARVQSILYDAARFRAAREAGKHAVRKPLPPVQRPGVASSRRMSADEQIQKLSQRLDKTHNLKDAARLLSAERKANRRGAR